MLRHTPRCNDPPAYILQAVFSNFPLTPSHQLHPCFRAPKEAPATDAEGNPVEEPVPVPEEPDNEITLEDALKLKAEKKAALMALMKKEDSNAAKVVDDSAFKGMAITKKDDTDHMPGFEISNEKAKIRRDREKKGGEKKTVDVGFKTAPVQTDDRDDRGGRGGRDGGIPKTSTPSSEA